MESHFTTSTAGSLARYESRFITSSPLDDAAAIWTSFLLELPLREVGERALASSLSMTQSVDSHTGRVKLQNVMGTGNSRYQYTLVALRIPHVVRFTCW
jgi:hypothetical protein